MKNLTWQNPEQLFVAQVLINKVKSKCCGIKVQFNIARPGVKDTSDEFNSSVSAFKEILEELKPDVIITWGYGLFNRLYPLGEKDGEKLFLANGDEVNTRWFSTGGENKALMIRQRHPSRGYSWREWAKVFQDLFN